MDTSGTLLPCVIVDHLGAFFYRTRFIRQQCTVPQCHSNLSDQSALEMRVHFYTWPSRHTCNSSTRTHRTVHTNCTNSDIYHFHSEINGFLWELDNRGNKWAREFSSAQRYCAANWCMQLNDFFNNPRLTKHIQHTTRLCTTEFTATAAYNAKHFQHTSATDSRRKTFSTLTVQETVINRVFLSLDCVSGTLCLSHYVTETSHL